MTYVYKRFRKTTELDFLCHIIDLQTVITKFVMNDKKVPKKWRYIIGQPLVQKVDEILDNIIYANSIYPRSIEELSKRKYYQEMAIANCYQIQFHIIRLEKCIPTVTIENLENIIELLNVSMSCINAWKKSNSKFKKEIEKQV